ncbi:P63C domain-containing protein [bacterium]|nr:P63C domain-containing protein [bacterium]
MAVKLTKNQNLGLGEFNMTEKILRAIWGSPDKPLILAGFEIPCYVLEDGTRVLSVKGMQAALSLGQSNGAAFMNLIGQKNIKPFINEHLARTLSNPIRFIRPGHGGRPALSYEATVLADICNSLLKAGKEGQLTLSQQRIADHCEMLSRAFTNDGLIALIDKITGYQEVRHRDLLQEIIKKYITKDLMKWQKRFPDEFYRQIFRLKNWSWRGKDFNPSPIVGKYINDVVYERLAPAVLQDLKKVNPPDKKRGGEQHHGWLTEEVGHPKLRDHLMGIIALMRAAPNWPSFKRMLERAYPKKGDTIDFFNKY